MNKLITETEIVEYMVSNNYIVHMPPIKSYKIKLKIKKEKSKDPFKLAKGLLTMSREEYERLLQEH